MCALPPPVPLVLAIASLTMNILSNLLRLCLAASAVDAFPRIPFLQRRAVLPNAQVIGLPEAVPAGVLGEVYEAYQPYLAVYNGCVPSPAVDVNGNTK